MGRAHNLSLHLHWAKPAHQFLNAKGLDHQSQGLVVTTNAVGRSAVAHAKYQYSYYQLEQPHVDILLP
ncbi:hypothetical protein TorRG33x02_113450 [Trema orientale]|uniref:Uncharacterized protein n=1 Tax=Trema orientale TaxID=63057 RepID=A0A2P5F4N3_TREOI|nr:hypothetical protein TorRG33x02_113450 [Trema orientale]